MTQVPLKLVNGKWNEVEESDFKLDAFLLERLRRVEHILSKDFDAVLIFDGMERAGKSTLAMMCAWYLSKGKITLKNFVRGIQDAGKKIAELPDHSVLIVDEASLVFSAKDSASQAQKKLMKILDVVGQKNMVFILCLPCFFDLNKTIAVRRSKFLIHVKPDKDYNRGTMLYWGERKKKMLYKHGKQNYESYGYPRHDWAGKYTPFFPPFYEEYKNTVKKDSLNEVLSDEKTPAQNKRDELWKKRLYDAIVTASNNKQLSIKQACAFLGLDYALYNNLDKLYGGRDQLVVVKGQEV